MHVKKILQRIIVIFPALIIISFVIHFTLPSNQGEFPENNSFLDTALILMLVNTLAIITSLILNFKNFKQNILLNLFSIFLGTPFIITPWILYHNTLRMNLNLDKTKYLRDECFMKWRNIYKAENRFHFYDGYCPTAVQDSIIVTEIYRTGSVKSCGLILNDKYYEIDPVEITFLTKKEKEELLSY